jgi:ferritin-like metal-binding protein YciE
MPPTPEEVRDWVGSDVLDAEGTGLGRLIGAYLDDAGRPQWLAVEIDERVAPVPAAGAEPAGRVVRVAALATDVRLAPRIGRDEPLGPGTEAQLAAHYRREQPPSPPEATAPPQLDPEQRAAVVAKLREAYSLEGEALLRLEALIATVSDDEVGHDATLHSDETQLHRTGVEERLKALDAAPSKLRDVAHGAQAAAAGVAGGVQGAVAAVRDAEEFERREAAFYAELEQLARAVGDSATATLAAKHRADEEAMAVKLAGSITRLDSPA